MIGDARSMRERVAGDGLAYRKGVTHRELLDFLEELGRPIHVEEVRDTPHAQSLVRSRNGIGWHTDHHRAERIVWMCLAQADEGGETLIVDGRAALGLLEPATVAMLRRVTLFEHSVFRGDDPRHPLLSNVGEGQPRIYFSLWLADEKMTGVERDAVDAFAAALDQVPHHRFRLEPGDVLAIDNTRMLHARTEIRGSSVRHLRRYWLSAT